MATYSFNANMKLGQTLAKALGLAGLPLEKIILSWDATEPARVYVKGLVSSEQAEALSTALVEVLSVQDAVVDPMDCSVTYARKDEGEGRCYEPVW